jgi:hypothetical protein
MEINLLIIVGFVKQVCHFTRRTFQTAMLPHLSTNILHTSSDNTKGHAGQTKSHPSEDMQFYKITVKGGMVIRRSVYNHDYS